MRLHHVRGALTAITSLLLLAPGVLGQGASTFVGTDADAVAPADVGAAAHPGPMSDADFFGVWSGGGWTVAPRLAYASADGLGDVEDAVRAGDYGLAKTELLAYFRSRPAIDIDTFTHRTWPGALELTPDHIWTLGRGEVYLETFDVGPQTTTVTIDVTESVIDAQPTSVAGFILMSRLKDDDIAYVHSNLKGSGEPSLHVTLADGSVRTLVSEHDTYINAGNPDTVYGAKYLMQVADAGSGPFTDATSKAYLQFDLGGIDEIVAAELSLTGHADRRKDIMVFGNSESFDENARTWSNTVQNTYSWQGDPGGFDWLQPNGADSEYVYQLTRFFFAGPLALAYVETGDESYASTLIDLMIDFIGDADSGYDSKYGAGSYPGDLHAARRLQNWLAAYEILRTSPSLDAEKNTEILKTLYKSGAYLADATVSSPNKMQTMKFYLLQVGVAFDEFVEAAAWRDNAADFLAEQLVQTTYPDGGYVEASGGYTDAYASQYVDIVGFMQEHGVEFPALELLRALAHAMMDQSFPDGRGSAHGDSGQYDQRSRFRRLGELLDDEELQYVGTSGASGSEPAHTSAVYPDTRVAVSRSGWQPDDTYLRLNVDRGSHSHPDELAVTAYAYGRQLLPDMGAYSYSSDPRAVWLRRSTEANNTIEVDDTAQESTADGAITHFIANPAFDRIGAHTLSSAGVRHNRSVFSLHAGPHAGMWVVSDRLDPLDGAAHRYEQHWHFLPTADVSMPSASKAAVTNFAGGANLSVVPADPAEVDAVLRDGYYSPEFYHVERAKYVSYVKTAADHTTFDTLLLPANGSADAAVTIDRLPVGSLPTYLVTAFDIGFGDGSTGTYFKSWTTRESRSFGPYTFDGKVLYAATTPGSAEPEWIALTDATVLERDGAVLVSSPAPIPDLAFSISDGTLRIDGTGLVAETDPATAIGIAAPDVTSVVLNGRTVEFSRHGDLIHAAAVG